jgi:quercetin dioxygenase-like cupin family protein
MLSSLGESAMPVIRYAESRQTRTPVATMTTLASPTQGGAGQVVWRVDMESGKTGPLHAIDTEQVWTVLDGRATVELDGETFTVGPGDTLILPADAPRRLSTGAQAGFAAIAVAPAGTRAYTLDGTRVAPGCAVPDGDKLVPAWVA